ncbi:MAG: carotenoid biosynthesis protein [Sphaerochaetaceae bacterium]|jgi:putative membrane protein|nr:carotenoid biosynthesis protein [Sphaerochaetaceae bacterium]
MNLKKTWTFDRWVALLLPPFYLVGIFGHAFEATFELMITLTPLTILTTVVLAYYPIVVKRDTKLLIWLAVSFAVTLVLEIIGVATSLIFGSYSYGSTLGLKLLEVPLVIGLNWTIVILGIVSFLDRLHVPAVLSVIGTGVLASAFDWIMEPVAIALDYWTWTGSDIPIQNYIAWALIAAACAGAYKGFRLQCKSWVPSLIVGIQTVFFFTLRFIVV